MSEYELIEERLISGTGVMRITQDADFRDIVIYAEVVRLPINLYQNLNFDPPKGFYAHIQQMYDGYVVSSADMNFENEMIRIIPDVCKQVMIGLKCIDNNIVNMLTLLGDDITGVEYSFFPQLTEMTSRPLLVDELVFSCYTDTALRVSQYGLKVVKCTPERDDVPPKPRKPDPIDKLPPGSPIGDISPPYDEEDNFTKPADIDESVPDPDPNPDLPAGDECQRVRCTSAITTTTNGREVRSEVVYGPVTEFFLNPSGGPDGNTRDAILLTCRGLAEFNGAVQPCIPPVTYVWQDAAPEEFISAEIIEATPL